MLCARTAVSSCGGTPTFHDDAQLKSLMEQLGRHFALSRDDTREFSIEVDPRTVGVERLAALAGMGFNRISLGVQDIDPAVQKAVNRIQPCAMIETCLNDLRGVGIGAVNVDLMYGLPGDDITGSIGDLERAIALDPSHLSWYQLTLEPNTRFERFPPALPDDDLIAGIEAAGRALLAGGMFERYEISAYARHGFRCRHNLAYWTFSDYMGIGAGAHGKLTCNDGTIERRAKTRNPKTYIETAGTDRAVNRERIDDADAQTTEFLMNALRLVDGVPGSLLAERTRALPDGFETRLDKARRVGWLDTDPKRLCATPEGLASLNRLLEIL